MNRLIFPAVAALLTFLAFLTFSCSDDPTASNENNTTQFEIVSVHPASGVEVSVLDSVVITFSSDVDCETVDASTITVGSVVPPGVSGTIICEGNKIIFKPENAFDPFITVGVTVSSEVTSTDGTGLASNYHYFFFTRLDPGEQFEIISVQPTIGAEVSIQDSVVITFSSDLDCGTVDASTITVGPGSSGTIICEANKIVFKPEYAFDFAIIVQVTVSKDVTNTDGTGLADDFSYSFYTEVEPGK